MDTQRRAEAQVSRKVFLFAGLSTTSTVSANAPLKVFKLCCLKKRLSRHLQKRSMKKPIFSSSGLYKIEETMALSPILLKMSWLLLRERRRLCLIPSRILKRKKSIGKVKSFPEPTKKMIKTIGKESSIFSLVLNIRVRLSKL